jgi:nitrogen-specific signal transduction histidine kinase
MLNLVRNAVDAVAEAGCAAGVTVQTAPARPAASRRSSSASPTAGPA